mmetsp:Transcript_140639/g.437414  ORF Transcript_140639/g.437414 Transcript_140639/m.437414 type:complete len:206 (+) Transcript_140639:1148-1765(+)
MWTCWPSKKGVSLSRFFPRRSFTITFSSDRVRIASRFLCAKSGMLALLRISTDCENPGFVMSSWPLRVTFTRKRSGEVPPSPATAAASSKTWTSALVRLDATIALEMVGLEPTMDLRVGAIVTTVSCSVLVWGLATFVGRRCSPFSSASAMCAPKSTLSWMRCTVLGKPLLLRRDRSLDACFRPMSSFGASRPAAISSSTMPEME